MAQIVVGATLPDGTLDWYDESDQHQSLTIHGLAKGKKLVLVGVPGAFTPTCRCLFFFIFLFYLRPCDVTTLLWNIGVMHFHILYSKRNYPAGHFNSTYTSTASKRIDYN
jgi:Redoxin